jgi:hypothetical protein
MDLKAIERKAVGWFHLSRDRDQWWGVVNMGSIKCGEFLEEMSDY